MIRSNTRELKGWIQVAQYKYAVPLKNGKWTIYEGCWGNNAEDNIAYPEVVRDSNKKPARYNSLEEIIALYDNKVGK